MQPLILKAGTRVLIGSPAKPLDSALFKTITDLVAGVPGIAEAYLPQFYAAGVVDPPSQVLVLVIDPNAPQQAVLAALGDGLQRGLPGGMHLDVLPLPATHPLMVTVRDTHCTVKEPAATAPTRPWWKRWF